MSYFEDKQKQTKLHIKELLTNLPISINDFIQYKANKLTPLSQLNYIYDLRMFLEYLISSKDYFINKNIKIIDYIDLRFITAKDIQNFITEISINNSNTGQNRKLSSIKSFFKYLYRFEYIEKDVSSLIEFGDVKEKPLIYLEINEILDVIDNIDSGINLTKRQLKFLPLVKSRDKSLFILFCTTGCRLQEIQSLSLGDIDLKNKKILVHRKGNFEQVINLSNECTIELQEYLQERKSIIPCTGHEEALFLSIQKKRLSRRAIQVLITKYSQHISKLKHITPHKLRTSLAMLLYRENPDLYLVAKQLGHKSITSTEKYAKADDDTLRQVINHLELQNRNDKS